MILGNASTGISFYNFSFKISQVNKIPILTQNTTHCVKINWAYKLRRRALALGLQYFSNF
jgi:hypothetical protein